MSGDEEAPEKGFRVTDKRKIKRDEAGGVDGATGPATPATGEASGSAQAGDEEPRVLRDNAGVHVGSAPQGDSTIDFGNFVMSLAHSALVSLGMVEHPELGATGVDLETASQTIQILEMLKAKTKNNLEPEEEHLISSLLYELRMAFVDVAQKAKQQH